MRRRSRSTAAAALLLALPVGTIGALLTGCTASRPPTATLPHGITADVKQYRDDYGPRILQLRIGNAGDDPVTIRRLALSSPSLAAPATWKGADGSLAAGRTIDFPAALPEARCGAHSAPQPRMRIDFTAASGVRGTTTLTATQSLRDLDRIHRLDCVGERVRTIASVIGSTLTISGTGAGSVARLGIAVTPTGAAGDFTITGVQSTVLLSPSGTSATGWPLAVSVAGRDAPSTVTVDVVPTRCDAHVIAEDKVGTILKTHVRIGGTTDGVFPLPLADGIRAKLLAFVAAHCGLG